MKYILLIMFTMITFISNGQYFTGEITYRIKTMTNIDNKVIETEHMSYIISDTKYKLAVTSMGKPKYTYTYDNIKKRIYDKHYKKPYITFRSSKDFEREFQKPVVLRDSVKYVLGSRCFLLEQKAEGISHYLYYSEDEKINYKNFKDHNVGNWYKRQEIVDGALPLLMISKTDRHTSITEAIKIEKRNVSESEFDLPDMDIYPSSEILDKSVKIKPFTQKQVGCYTKKIQKLKGFDKRVLTSVSFILTKDKIIKNLAPVFKDSAGFYKIAMDIIKDCNLTLTPGEINGEKVDCEVIIPFTIN